VLPRPADPDLLLHPEILPRDNPSRYRGRSVGVPCATGKNCVNPARGPLANPKGTGM
jgi:hypothetical protein